MISEEMFQFLRRIPRHPAWIEYDSLLKSIKNISTDRINSLKSEASDDDYGYINDHLDGKISLTEKGCVALEAYRHEKSNRSIMTWSLFFSLIAMIAAVASAVTTIIR